MNWLQPNQQEYSQPDMNCINQEISVIKSKRDAFQKEIRSRKRQEYFSAQRKIIHSLERGIQENRKERYENFTGMVFRSIYEVEEHLKDTQQVPDYFAINQFFDKNPGFSLSDNLFNLITLHESQEHFFRNQHALAMTINLFNHKDLSVEKWLTEDRIRYYINSVVTENIINEDQNNNIRRLDYHKLVSWYLYVLANVTKNKEFFMEIKEQLSMIENQAFDEMPYEVITLLSELSTDPKLLPSGDFVYRLLSHEPLVIQGERYWIHVVNLVENYFRYLCSQLDRFDQNESLEMTLQYFRFIIRKLKNYKFPVNLSCDLINMVSTMVCSYSEEMTMHIFELPEAKEFLSQIFYISDLLGGPLKYASFYCLGEIICRVQLLNQITEHFGSEKLFRFFLKSLTFLDRTYQLYALGCIGMLVGNTPNLYLKHFKNSNFLDYVEYLKVTDSRNPQEDLVLTEIALTFYQNILSYHN